MAEEDKLNDKNFKICTSVFKNGDNTTKEIYTQKWIELISVLERTKRASFPPRS